MKRTVHNYHHVYDVTLAKEGLEVAEIKLYLSQLPGMENVHFKLIVKILGSSNELLLFKTFEEQVFAQFANPTKQAGLN